MTRLRTTTALVAVLALVAAACSAADPAPETSAADAPLRSTTTTVPPPPALERVALEASVLAGEGDQQMVAVAAGTSLTAGAGRFVAVGRDGDRPGVWWSADGLGWQRPALDPDVFGEGATLADVVADPVSGGFVAVGGVGEQAAAWMSPDGETWTAAYVDAGPAMEVVGTTRLGLIAFGTGAPSGTPGVDPAEETVAWQSFSGERWLRAVDAPDLFARPGTERVAAVVDAGREVLALVDREGQGPELWRTTDGLFWSAHPEVGTELLPAAGAPGVGAATALGSALVVVGTDAKADGVDAATWLSTADRAFEAVDHDEEVFGGDGTQAMAATAQVGDRLIMVGTETGDDGDVDAVVWSSGFGPGVVRTGGPALPVPGDQHVVDIAALGTAAVAVGREATASGVDAAAWRVVSAPAEAGAEAPPSAGTERPPPDLAWQRVVGQESLAGPGEQRMEAVAALADGFLAVGSVAGPDGDLDGGVWRSVDGQDWEVVAPGTFGGPGDQALLDVAAGPAGLAAVGVDAGSAAVWTSPDGATWTRATHDEGTFGGPGEQRAEAVTALPAGLGWVVVGVDGRGDGAVWASPDGGLWGRVAAEGLGGGGDQAVLDVVSRPSGLVAVGADGGAATAWTSAEGTLWSPVDLGPGQASAVAGSEAGLVAVGSTTGDGTDAVAWRSADGVSWGRVEGDELAGPADQELAGVVVGDEVVAAVGDTDLGGGGDAAAWTSADAGAWLRSDHDENVFGGDQAQRMTGVASVGGLVVAVGWSGSTPESRDAGVWVASLAGGSARSRL